MFPLVGTETRDSSVSREKGVCMYSKENKVPGLIMYIGI